MNQNPQSGMAILWILMAVALMAAISIALMEGSRSSTSMLTSEADTARAYQDQDDTNTINAAVQRLKIRGCTTAQISYETPDGANVNANAPEDESCHVYSVKGGQVVYQQ